MVGLDMKTNNIDEQDIRINKIIANIDRTDIMALLNAWKKYLENVLVFPIEARILGYTNEEPLKYGDYEEIYVAIKKLCGNLRFPCLALLEHLMSAISNRYFIYQIK